jgi:4a-hydroxytetrahydrobiopterin dehydratase
MHADLGADELRRLADTLPAWQYDPDRQAIRRHLRFANFGEALAAMVRIGVEAEKADHHPEWTNVYDRLDIWLTTHDAGGVSGKDEAMAALIDGMFPECAT